MHYFFIINANYCYKHINVLISPVALLVASCNCHRPHHILMQLLIMIAQETCLPTIVSQANYSIAAITNRHANTRRLRQVAIEQLSSCLHLLSINPAAAFLLQRSYCSVAPFYRAISPPELFAANINVLLTDRTSVCCNSSR